MRGGEGDLPITWSSKTANGNSSSWKFLFPNASSVGFLNATRFTCGQTYRGAAAFPDGRPGVRSRRPPGDFFEFTNLFVKLQGRRSTVVFLKAFSPYTGDGGRGVVWLWTFDAAAVRVTPRQHYSVPSPRSRHCFWIDRILRSPDNFPPYCTLNIPTNVCPVYCTFYYGVFDAFFV